MDTFKTRYLKLNHLILVLALSATAITFVNSFYSIYEVQKEQLISQTIDINRSYAKKLADTTEVFIAASKQQLKYAAESLRGHLDDEAFIQQEADRLKYQNHSFNSVSIVSKEGFIHTISPSKLPLKGAKLSSKSSFDALEKQIPLISEPFTSSINNLLVVISTPLWDKNGDYYGYLGGTIYLKDDSIIRDILGDHHYRSGSFISVIDQNKNILYHPNETLIGVPAKRDEKASKFLALKEGGMLLEGKSYQASLAGFATIPSTGWVVITQSPLDTSLTPLSNIMEKVILRTLPMALGVFLFIWLFARAISLPLQQLASQVKLFDGYIVSSEIDKINSWYSESLELKKAILSKVKTFQSQIGKLKVDADTDPLTGANNRRAFDLRTKQLVSQKIEFSVLCLDVDHFKNVNDTYGHSLGDEVLKQLVEVMNSFSRAYDMVARMGGEEFILLLQDGHMEDSMLVAERLRETIAEASFGEVGHITVSIGVACKSDNSISVKQLLSAADKALYRAKREGRNRSIAATQGHAMS
ncbi:sensor domain-containing diguanylate cyclase [Marinomonas sp.]